MTTEGPDPIRQPHDALFRAAFEDPGRAAQLLRSALPGALAEAVDWGSLRRIDASFVDVELRRQHADLLFAASVGGREALLYLLLEHKSGDDPWCAFQLLRYVVRIWERWRRERPEAPRLPPVLPFVLHHGATRWRGPRDLRGCIDVAGLPPAMLALQPQLEFVLDDLAGSDGPALARRRLAVETLLVLLHLQQLRRESSAAALLVAWRELYAAVCEAPGGSDLVEQLVAYVAAVAADPLDELAGAYARIRVKTEDQFMTLAERLIQQGLDRGRQEGRQEGRLEGRIEALLAQLSLRFGPVAPTLLERVRSAGLDELDRWTVRVLDAAAIDEVFAD